MSGHKRETPTSPIQGVFSTPQSSVVSPIVSLKSPLLTNTTPQTNNGSPQLSWASSLTSQGTGIFSPWGYYRKMIKGDGLMNAKRKRKAKKEDRSASVFGCIFNMLATILGSGLLALPYAMAGCGVWLGIFVFIIIMILSTISFVTLSMAVQVYTANCEFKTLALDSLPKQLNWIVDFCVFINCFGCGSGFLVVMSTLMPEVIQSLSPHAIWWVVDRRLWCLFFAGCAFPLTLPKNLDALKFTSFLVVIFVLFALGVMTYYAVEPPKYDHPFTPVVYYGFPNDVIEFLKVFAIIVNAFASSQNVPCIVNTLVNPTQKRLRFIFTTATGICLVVYVGAAYTGYVTFGTMVDSDVLRSYPSGLIPVNIARFAITLALVGSYPVQLHPARNSMSMLLFGVPASKLKAIKYLAVTIGVWGTTVLVALSTDDLGTVATFIGALAGVPLTFIYPNWFWIKISPRLGPNQSVWHSWIILVLGLLFVPVLLSTELYKLSEGNE